MLKVGSSFFSIQVKAHSQTCWCPLIFISVFFDVIGALKGGEHLFGFSIKLSQKNEDEKNFVVSFHAYESKMFFVPLG